MSAIAENKPFELKNTNPELLAWNYGLHVKVFSDNFLTRILEAILSCFGYVTYSDNKKLVFVNKTNFVARLNISDKIELNAENVQALTNAFFASKGRPLDLTDEELSKSKLFQQSVAEFEPDENLNEEAYKDGKIQIVTSTNPKEAIIKYLQVDALGSSLVHAKPHNPIPAICAKIIKKRKDKPDMLTQLIQDLPDIKKRGDLQTIRKALGKTFPFQAEAHSRHHSTPTASAQSAQPVPC